MKVSMDLQPCLGNKSGIGLYTHEIARRLTSDIQISYQGEAFDFLGRHENGQLQEEFNFSVKVCEKLPFGVYRRMRKYVPNVHEMLFGEADIHHFSNYIVPPHVSGKVITSIFDLTYLRYPETMAKRTYEYLRDEMDYSIKRSEKIITISDFVRNEIIEMLEVPEDRVETVYLGPSITEKAAPIEAVRKKFGIKEQAYILYLGTIEPRKNLVRLIQAYNLMRQDTGLEQQLVMAGGKGWNCEEIYQEANQSPYAKDIIFTDYISTEEKTALYKYAEIFVFPSIYEGFGMPLLEAMHFKVPVLTANVASMPEVAGDAAELVNPFEVEHIAEGMKAVLLHKTYCMELVEKGIKRVSYFNWDRAAAQIQEVHRSFL